MIEIDRLREAFQYDAEMGHLLWKINTGKKRLIGKRAGGMSGGYIKVGLDGHQIQEHIAIWAIAKGEWPACEIDHVNGNRQDNKLENLREATRQENARNISRNIKNRSGYKGVSWCSETRRWRAAIKVARRAINLGRYPTKEGAAAAYNRAAVYHFGEFAKINDMEHCRWCGASLVAGKCIRCQEDSANV